MPWIRCIGKLAPSIPSNGRLSLCNNRRLSLTREWLLHNCVQVLENSSTPYPQYAYVLFEFLCLTSQSRCLFVIRWHLVVNVAYQRYPHLRCVVASKDVTDEVGLNLHMHLYSDISFELGPVSVKYTPSPMSRVARPLVCLRTTAHLVLGRHRVALRSRREDSLQR
jgi:hypothetical protein